MEAVLAISTSPPAVIGGFTLIELMVVVAIVAILATIAYPSYEEQVRKTRRAEGKVALNEVASRLERCFTRFNAYNAAGCSGVDQMTSENDWYRVSASVIAASSYLAGRAATRTGDQRHQVRHADADACRRAFADRYPAQRLPVLVTDVAA